MLNPFLYFKRNAKKPILIICISSLAVLVISLTVAIISSIQISTEKVVVNQFDNYSAVIYKETDGMSESILEEKLPNVDLYEVSIDYTNFNTVLGTNSSFLYSFFDEDTMQAVFKRCGQKLVAGRMPNIGCSEIILHESILKNRDLSIGDQLGTKKIVGAMDGNCIVGYSFFSDDELKQVGYLSPSFMVFSKDTDTIHVRTILDKLDSDIWQTFTYTGMNKQLDDEMSTINLIMLMIVVMIVTCLSVAVSALIFTIYSGRYDEFAILNAMGYRKRTIRVLIVSEIVVLAVFSWILGYSLSLAGMLIVNKTIYQDLGQQMPLFSEQGFCYSILLPFLSIICAVLPVSRKLSKTDLIGIIERR